MTAVADRLDAIQAQLDAATPGPWFAEGGNGAGYRTVYYVFHNGETLDRDRVADSCGPDAEFIAAAPENTRYLLGLARKQQAQLDAVRALANQWNARGESDMAFSKTIPDENISIALLTDGATMVENARHIRNALEAKL